MTTMDSDWLKNWKSLKILEGMKPNLVKIVLFIVVLFQNYIRWPCQLSNMVTTSDYATFNLQYFLYSYVLNPVFILLHTDTLE